MSIGAGVSLGGNLYLCGMSACVFPLGDPAAPPDPCSGGGSCTGGNGSANGSGGSNLESDNSGGCCGNSNGGSGNGNGNGGGVGILTDSGGGDNSQCCSNNSGGNGNGGGGGGVGILSGTGSGGGNSQCCSGGSGGSGGGNGGPIAYPTDSGNGLPCPPNSGPTPSCVQPQTRIALFPDGCKTAAEVEVGNVLLTRTPEGTLVGEAVTAVVRSVQPCLALVTEDGRRLLCSESHEVMVADAAQLQGRQTRACELTLSDRLLLEAGTPVRLVAVTPQPTHEVLRISLAGPHHVYLSDGLWSHNKITPLWYWPTPGSIH